MSAIMSGEASTDGRTRRQKVADCAGNWLEEQSQEFRDGIEREIGEFRSGVDSVRRGLQWLGSRLRHAE